METWGGWDSLPMGCVAIEDPELLAIWQVALSEEAGVKLKTSDVTYFKMRMYRVRKKSGDHRLMGLSIITWQNREEADLGIIHNAKAPTVNPATNLAAIDLGRILDLDE